MASEINGAMVSGEAPLAMAMHWHTNAGGEYMTKTHCQALLCNDPACPHAVFDAVCAALMAMNGKKVKRQFSHR